jgi:hypothetical protein
VKEIILGLEKISETVKKSGQPKPVTDAIQELKNLIAKDQPEV